MRVRFAADVAYVEFCDSIRLDCNAAVHGLDRRLLGSPPAWLVETVAAYSTLAVTFDPRRAGRPEVEAALRRLASSAGAKAERDGEAVLIRTRYGGEDGPDLGAVARRAGLSERQVVEIHAGRTYTCYMLGFTPGFVYLGDLDPRIAAPRLDTPRTRVPAGSVGIAGGQTGVYGVESPGGWLLIGRAAEAHFDPSRNPPSMVKPGDRVRFVEVR
ncbi:MAG: 5-oxoprolinase subunit PxpB [Nitrososphaerota archaeon]|nr:5-oxoprolinase subunit PxpB [Nitrososphaerota archaeon]MDG6939950.1 5-oxoprolinase subunit PxpB [Nitrososphaerota archaeon]